VLQLALVAVALGLSNFAASIGIGLAGVDSGLRFKVVLTFGFFEAVMPVIGLLVGNRVANGIGSAGAYIGGAVLVAVGVYNLVQARRASGGHPVGDAMPLRTLIVTGAALSLDNLAVGFGLGAESVPILLAAVVIACVSVAMSLVGLELGSRFGRVVEHRAQDAGSLVLIVVGVAIASGAL